jgi:hypothetical protein
MKHVQTFENFINDLEKKTYQNNTNESFVNESNLGSITNIIYDDSPQWIKFWKKAKKGDTFMYYPSGVESYFINSKDLIKNIIRPRIEESGYVMGGANDKKCTIIERKTVKIRGIDELDDSTPYDTIFYTMEGEPSTKVYVLPNLS